MPEDLSRIGVEPDCDYPGCLLVGRTRTWLRAVGEHRILCSIHDDWDGTPPEPTKDDALKAMRAALRPTTDRGIEEDS